MITLLLSMKPNPLDDFHHRVGATFAVQRFVALVAGITTIGYVVSP